uniref:Uncharacterized protein n=1 Tax=Mycena chlorophos TaxID=658473 RepID=A0ABQ0KWJ0_MYCCL|nr:predicted protein [Mycena chlorophos]
MLPRLDRDASGPILSEPLWTHRRRTRPAYRVHYASSPAHPSQESWMSFGLRWTADGRDLMLGDLEGSSRRETAFYFAGFGPLVEWIGSPRRWRSLRFRAKACCWAHTRLKLSGFSQRVGRLWSTRNWAKLKPERMPDEDSTVPRRTKDHLIYHFNAPSEYIFSSPRP